MLPVTGGAAGSWNVITPCGNDASVSAGQVIGGATVVIDPGHGGDETGAVGPDGLVEADVNLDVALRVARLLEAKDISVVLTRSSDYRVTIATRAEIALAIEPDVFLSIHHNGGSPEVIDEPGTEVYFQSESPEAERLGSLVYEEVFRAMSTIDVEWTGNPYRGAQWRLNTEGTDLYGILRRPEGVVTALSEAMFLSSAAEEQQLRDPNVLQLEAEALATAVERFLRTDDYGTGVIDGVVFQGLLTASGGSDGCVDPDLG